MSPPQVFLHRDAAQPLLAFSLPNLTRSERERERELQQNNSTHLDSLAHLLEAQLLGGLRLREQRRPAAASGQASADGARSDREAARRGRGGRARGGGRAHGGRTHRGRRHEGRKGARSFEEGRRAGGGGREADRVKKEKKLCEKENQLQCGKKKKKISLSLSLLTSSNSSRPPRFRPPYRACLLIQTTKKKHERSIPSEPLVFIYIPSSLSFLTLKPCAARPAARRSTSPRRRPRTSGTRRSGRPCPLSCSPAPCRQRGSRCSPDRSSAA